MDDTQRILKCGNLSLHTPGGFFKKRWHSKYLVLYDGSKSGVKRLELFDSEIKFKKQNPAKIIPLVDCVRVVTCQRYKSSYTFEVRTNDQFYLLAAQSFQDMNDWVNCLRLVAFGQQAPSGSSSCVPSGQQLSATNGSSSAASINNPEAAGLIKSRLPSAAAAVAGGGGGGTSVTTAPSSQVVSSNSSNRGGGIDVLLERSLRGNADNNNNSNLGEFNQVTRMARQQHNGPQAVASAMGGGCPPSVSTETHPALVNNNNNNNGRILTATQAAAAAASALAKTRQRQPSLLGSCKPLPPTDSPFIQQANKVNEPSTTTSNIFSNSTLDTMTPTVRGQLIEATITASKVGQQQQQQQAVMNKPKTVLTTIKQQMISQPSLDEEEENMLYCSIEDNPSEHNYRVKVIETDLSLRCQLKCYQLTAPTTISQQYEQLGKFNSKLAQFENETSLLPPVVTFYQLIIGPQELTLLNDYAISQQLNNHSSVSTINNKQQQQGLWSWPYQCIRRYGFDKDNCFMFEAGRKCTSGPGQFIVQTPKAYQIYQDVVKFVNELRSLNNNSSEQQQVPNNNNNVVKSNQQAQQVTQIPVTWTSPTITNNNDNNNKNNNKLESNNLNAKTQDSRQQFFDTLRQLDSSCPQQQLQTVVIDSAINNNNNNNNNHQQNPMLKTEQTSQIVLNNETNGKIGTTTESLVIEKQKLLSPPTSAIRAALTAPTNRLTKNSAPSSTPEETDESGYDQGDESVDSSTMMTSSSSSSVTTSKAAFKSPSCNYNRKRQQQQQQQVVSDSMSSSSSTTSSRSSSSNAGSPNQSVSKRSSSSLSNNNNNNTNNLIKLSNETENANKRPSMMNVLARVQQQTHCSSKENTTKTTTQKPVKQQNISKAHSMTTSTHTSHNLIKNGEGLSLPQEILCSKVLKLAGNENQVDDFEANLIRDVYSEITKLHAKFAVTSMTGSADDSMSSRNSSSDGSSSAGGSTDDCSTTGGHDNEADGDVEPMYTNLTENRTSPIMGKHGEERNTFCDEMEPDDEIENNNQQHESLSSRNLFRQQQQYNYDFYNNNSFNYLSQQQQQQPPPPLRNIPIYPTILNPIPECGELNPPLSPKLNKNLKQQQHNQTKHPPKVAPKPFKYSAINQNNNASTTEVTSQSNLVVVGSKTRSDSLAGSNSKPPTPSPSHKPQSTSSLISKRINSNNNKSKLPTNHYVINDVQYAKISRDMKTTNYDSFL